ncbi:MAG: DUF503 domain-containing protein [Sporomusaceae bacterium]|jgi:uncharacterized protein YlxP (DUF503 family)|nr:DUF503 domain-containing protein [Sporomusaceae bacterium]
MTTLTLRLVLTAPFCHSLKDKRMIIRSISDKTRRKYNVSIAEVEAQDTHQTIILGIALVSGNATHAKTVLDDVVRFIENNTEAELIRTDFL